MITVADARKTIATALREDPELWQTYVDNVACLLMDRVPWYRRTKLKRDAIAGEIIYLLFNR